MILIPKTCCFFHFSGGQCYRADASVAETTVPLCQSVFVTRFGPLDHLAQTVTEVTGSPAVSYITLLPILVLMTQYMANICMWCGLTWLGKGTPNCCVVWALGWGAVTQYLKMILIRLTIASSRLSHQQSQTCEKWLHNVSNQVYGYTDFETFSSVFNTLWNEWDDGTEDRAQDGQEQHLRALRSSLKCHCMVLGSPPWET